MRVLLIARCPPYPLHLGDRLIVWHLARELKARGHSIDLLAFAERPQDWHEVHHYARHFRRVQLFHPPRRGYLRRLLRPAARFPERAVAAWSPELWEAIRARRAVDAYDIAHVFGGVAVYEVAGALGRLPAIITPYESYSLFLKRMMRDSAQPITARAGAALRWRIARAYESWMYRPYRRTVVVAEPDAAELRGLAPGLPVEVIPNGVDLDFFTPTAAPREPDTLLFTGNFEYAPNVDAAFRLLDHIMPRVWQKRPNAALWLVGNAPPARLLARAGAHVQITGRVPDLRPYLGRAAAYIAPLRLGAGIKNKVLEALAMGCPLIATPISADGIAVRPGVDALIAASDEELVGSALCLLGDPALAARLGAAGRALVEGAYSWASVAARYESLYRAEARP